MLAVTYNFEWKYQCNVIKSNYRASNENCSVVNRWFIFCRSDLTTENNVNIVVQTSVSVSLRLFSLLERSSRSTVELSMLRQMRMTCYEKDANSLVFKFKDKHATKIKIQISASFEFLSLSFGLEYFTEQRWVPISPIGVTSSLLPTIRFAKTSTVRLSRFTLSCYRTTTSFTRTSPNSNSSKVFG